MKTKITTFISSIAILSIVIPAAALAQTPSAGVSDPWSIINAGIDTSQQPAPPSSATGYQRDPCDVMLSGGNPSADIIAACKAETGTSGSGSSGSATGGSSGSVDTSSSGNDSSGGNGSSGSGGVSTGSDNSGTSANSANQMLAVTTQLQDLVDKLAAIPGSGVAVYPILSAYTQTSEQLNNEYTQACASDFQSSACLAQEAASTNGQLKAAQEAMQKLEAVSTSGNNAYSSSALSFISDPSSITFASQDGSGDQSTLNALMAQSNQLITEQENIEAKAFNSSVISKADFSAVYNKVSQVQGKLLADNTAAQKLIQSSCANSDYTCLENAPNSNVIKLERALIKLSQWEIAQMNKLLGGTGSINTNIQSTTGGSNASSVVTQPTAPGTVEAPSVDTSANSSDTMAVNNPPIMPTVSSSIMGMISNVFETILKGFKNVFGL